MTEPVVLVHRADGVATVTLNRPQARNAITVELILDLRRALADLDADSDVGAVVLTGAGPAFCAGLDLRELGERPTTEFDPPPGAFGPWIPMRTPLVGAVNGPAVTGGLEFALNCDLLIASDRARFADTHTRVGVLPGWGLTVLLPMAVGRARARYMSLTGDFLHAHDAATAGLVSEVVPHDELLPRAQAIASSIAGNDRRAVRALLQSYRGVDEQIVADSFGVEQRTGAAWNAAVIDDVDTAERRASVIARGRGRPA
ncbi:enoyl-CoA hydratase [Rhodococcoides fascians]|uniref:enoyl-CoA hydratase n=1 Tax=Rhodococcoides fascians TaxID=1828 RepID=UPI0009B917A5|nr:enoyl-CoA hydratase [Rhodococcus fascians]